MTDVYGRAGGNGYLSTSDVANDLDVTRSTVLLFIYQGILPAINVGDGNYRPRYGITLENLNKFKKQYIKGAIRIENPKKPGRKKKQKEDIVEMVEEIKVDPKDEEIKKLKEEMSLMAEKLLEISVKLEELSKK